MSPISRPLKGRIDGASAVVDDQRRPRPHNNQDHSSDAAPPKRNFSDLAYYVFLKFHLTRSQPILF